MIMNRMFSISKVFHPKMEIILPSSHIQFNFPFRIVGNAGRYDTVSDCRFIDEKHIVVADRQMASLYLIEFNISDKSYKIIYKTSRNELLLYGFNWIRPN